MSQPNLAKIEGRWAAATPGPWINEHPNVPGTYANIRSEEGNGCLVGLVGSESGNKEANAEAIAHAPEDVRALITRVKELEEMLDKVYRERDAARMQARRGA